MICVQLRNKYINEKVRYACYEKTFSFQIFVIYIFFVSTAIKDNTFLTQSRLDFIAVIRSEKYYNHGILKYDIKKQNLRFLFASFAGDHFTLIENKS